MHVNELLEMRLGPPAAVRCCRRSLAVRLLPLTLCQMFGLSFWRCTYLLQRWDVWDVCLRLRRQGARVVGSSSMGGHTRSAQRGGRASAAACLDACAVQPCEVLGALAHPGDAAVGVATGAV